MLKRLAIVVGRELRPEHIFGRIGGDEFGILLPETKAAQSEFLAEHLRQSIRDHQFEAEEGQVAVTCSFGVAEFALPMRDPRDLFKAADAALYRSKAEGRNRVYNFRGGFEEK